jgi:predicted RNA-binding protein
MERLKRPYEQPREVEVEEPLEVSEAGEEQLDVDEIIEMTKTIITITTMMMTTTMEDQLVEVGEELREVEVEELVREVRGAVEAEVPMLVGRGGRVMVSYNLPCP